MHRRARVGLDCECRALKYCIGMRWNRILASPIYVALIASTQSFTATSWSGAAGLDWKAGALLGPTRVISAKATRAAG